MQEDLGRHTQRGGGKIIMISCRALNFTTKVLTKAIRCYLDAKFNRGKQDIKHLINKHVALEKLDQNLTDKTLKSFDKAFKKYKVDYTVLKDKNTVPPTFNIFFKGRDEAVIRQCMEEVARIWEKDLNKGKEPISEKLKNFKEKSKKMEGEKSKTKDKASEKGEKVKEDAFEK